MLNLQSYHDKELHFERNPSLQQYVFLYPIQKTTKYQKKIYGGINQRKILNLRENTLHEHIAIVFTTQETSWFRAPATY